ncbi:MAG: peptidoglycan DD-metalloendopeptidase family protein [Chloroflexota bacterium]
MENQPFPEPGSGEDNKKKTRGPGLFSRWTGALLQMGLGESLLRASTNIFAVIAILVVIWLVQAFYRQGAFDARTLATQSANPTEEMVSATPVPPPADPSALGISRLAQVHTTIPSRPRQEIEWYIVQEGDTVFGIAEKYGLQPQTILWGNYGTLLDDPHNLKAGQNLIILPTDGTYYEWQSGDGLNGVAKFFGVQPGDIVNYAGNGLDPATVGDYAAPNIAPGTYLIIPGGQREFVSWSAPLGITRDDPAYARVLGPGACDPVSGGAIGYGAFIWPTNKHYLSGFDYSPKSNHWGIDIAGNTGEGVYAADAGVIVYAGWNNYGYGNMVIVDHGNGFQSLYAHLSDIYRFCGQSVGQGEGIGAVGSTGNSSGSHLHFEIMTPTYKVNPWDYLPPP